MQKPYTVFPILSSKHYPYRDYTELNGMCCLIHKICVSDLQDGAIGLADFRPDLPSARHAELGLHCLLRMVERFVHSQPSLRNAIIPVLERVPSSTDARKIVCYRLAIYYDPSLWQPALELEQMMAENCGLKGAPRAPNNDQKSRKRKAPAPTSRVQDARAVALVGGRHRELKTVSDLITMVTGLTQLHLEEIPETRQKALDDRKSPLNPVWIWSKDLAMVGIAEANPLFTDLVNYCSEEELSCLVRQYDEPVKRVHRYPDPQCVYLLPIDCITPEKFVNLNIPDFYSPASCAASESKNSSREDRARKDFLVRLGADPCSPEAMAKMRNGSEEAHRARLSLSHRLATQPWLIHHRNLDAFIYGDGHTLRSIHNRTLDTVALQNKLARAEIKDAIEKLIQEKKKTTPEIYAEASRMRREFEARAYEALPSVLHEHLPADAISPAIRSIIRWGNEYLRKNGQNLCWTQPKFTSNLSLAAEWIVRLTWHIETIHFCHVAHEAVIMILLSQYDAFHPDPKDKLHYMGIGPPGLAKSFSLNMNYAWSIPDTIELALSKSLLADTGRQCLDATSVHRHEIDDAMLGVRVGGASTATQAACTIFKSRLTEGRIVHEYLDPDTRDTKRVNISAIGTFQVNSNTRRYLIDAAIANRFLIKDFEHTVRPGKTLQECIEAAKCASDGIKKAQRNQQEQMQLMQYRVFLACYLIRLNILPDVDVQGATKIFNAVRDTLAEQSGILMSTIEDSRLIARMVAAARILTIVNRIYLLFDTEVSPLRDKKWDPSQMALLAPYLVTTTQEAVLVIGLFKSELEDHVRDSVLRALLDEYFPLTGTSPASIPTTSTTLYASSSSSTAAAVEEEKKEEVDEIAKREKLYKSSVDLYANYLCSKENVFGMKTVPKSSLPQQDNKESKTQPQQQPQQSHYTRQVTGEDVSNRIQMLTRRIIERMNPRPREGDVKSMLYKFANAPLKGETSQMVLHLKDVDGHLYLAKDAVRGLSDTLIQRAVLEAIASPHVPSQTLAFDISRNSSTPYVFNILQIPATAMDTETKSAGTASAPAPIKRRTKIRNSNYLDPKQRRFTLGLHTDRKGSLLFHSLDQSYDAAEHCDIDSNPEDEIWYRHLASVYWTQADMDREKLDTLAKMDEKALAAARERKDGTPAPVAYPEEVLIARNSPEFAKTIADEKAKPGMAAFYSTSLRTEKWKTAVGSNVPPILPLAATPMMV